LTPIASLVNVHLRAAENLTPIASLVNVHLRARAETVSPV